VTSFAGSGVEPSPTAVSKEFVTAVIGVVHAMIKPQVRRTRLVQTLRYDL
jgi:hypothetical protein